MEKRKFYNTGDAKGFTRAKFFETVAEALDTLIRNEDILEDADIDLSLIELARQAVAYEIEGLSLRNKSTTSSGEKKDPLQSDYAMALREAIVPLVDDTPRSAQELIELATRVGKLSPKGKPFSGPWVSRVLNATPGVAKVTKVVEKTNSKGLRADVQVTAYQIDG